jgi:hypothetical protein
MRTGFSWLTIGVMVDCEHYELPGSINISQMILSLLSVTTQRLLCSKESIYEHNRMHSLTIFFLICAVGLGYCGPYWPIVPAPDDRWWGLWRNWWNEDWQEKPKYFVHHKSHLTRPGFEPGPPRWEASDSPLELWRGPSLTISQMMFNILTGWVDISF